MQPILFHCSFSLVLCEYSKFRIESNSYFSIRFDSKRAQLFDIFEYLPSPISYLFDRMTPIFHLSNHAWQPTKSTNMESILAHYGPPSTETPTTETTTVQRHKNSWIYLTSTYYWWLLRPTITIRFDSIRFEMIENYSHSTGFHLHHAGNALHYIVLHYLCVKVVNCIVHFPPFFLWFCCFVLLHCVSVCILCLQPMWRV